MKMGPSNAPRYRRAVFVTTIVLAMACAPIHAGGIDEGQAPSGMEVFNDDLNNDASEPDFSGNFVIHTLEFHTAGHLDMVLPILQSGGVSEYDFVMVLHNLSGVDHSGLKVTLGFLSGSAFQQSTLPDLDFDAPDRNSFFALNSEPLHPIHHGDTQILWPELSDMLRSGNQHGMDFSLDIPDARLDGPPYIPAGALRYNGDDLIGYNLTIRFSPILIPEPAAAAALLPLAVPAVMKRRRA